MPLVAGGLQHAVGRVILFQGLVQVPVLLRQLAEVDMAEGDAQVRVCLLVHLQRLLVVVPGRVRLPQLLLDSSQVGQVDGLSQCAAQRVLALQCQAEHAVSHDEVAQRQQHIAHAIERHHIVLLGRDAVLVAHVVAHVGGLLVKLCRLFQRAQAPVVGADAVQRLYHLQGVADVGGQAQRLLVAVDGLGEAALLAVELAQVAQCHDFA